MAQVPEGGVVLPNPHGAAPGMVIPAKNGRLIFCRDGAPILEPLLNGRQYGHDGVLLRGVRGGSYIDDRHIAQPVHRGRFPAVMQSGGLRVVVSRPGSEAGEAPPISVG